MAEQSRRIEEAAAGSSLFGSAAGLPGLPPLYGPGALASPESCKSHTKDSMYKFYINPLC